MYAGTPSTSPTAPITRETRLSRACSLQRDKRLAEWRIYAATRPDYMVIRLDLRRVYRGVRLVSTASHREGDSLQGLALAP